MASLTDCYLYLKFHRPTSSGCNCLGGISTRDREERSLSSMTKRVVQENSCDA